MPFLRRLAFAPIVFLVVTAVTYGAPRILRPDRYPGESFVSGLAQDLNRVFFHLDFGCAVRAPAGSLPARLLEAAAMAAYCAQVFFVGLFVLWLFNPIAEAKGVHPRDIVRHHAAPLPYPGMMGLIADGIVSRLDPRVRLSHGRAW